MKKVKISHGMNKLIKDFFKIMRKNVGRQTTNNYRKMHGLPMRRKSIE